MECDKDNELDIAIVGMACRFPDADNVDQYWRNLLEGKVSLTRFSRDELLESGIPREHLDDEYYVPAAPILADADRFDSEFFGYSPHEALLIDPQQRQLLEITWQALEDAACDPSRFDGRIATFAGTAMNTYILHTGLGKLFSREYLPVLLAADKDYSATRIAFKHGLMGPAVTVQTACSTSLVATHLACQCLLSHEADMAIVAAAAIRSPLKTGHLYEEGSVFSSDGLCRPFDHKASGTVFGSGSGSIVLRRLEDALSDGDSVLAVIRGTAVNNDGRTKTDFTAPSVEMQAEAIADALANADVAADTISYVEAHGTGTYLGDPIEVEALTRAFDSGSHRHGYCALGSVKSNIGHLDAAAGMASIIKVVLAMRHGKIPATANFTEPNPQIQFSSSPFRVVSQAEKWKCSGLTPRRAGVSSLGMGGTNAHIVLEEAIGGSAKLIKKIPAKIENTLEILPLSAQSRESLDALVELYPQFLHSHEGMDIKDIAYTLQEGRKAFKYRSVVIASSTEQLGESMGEAKFPGAGTLNTTAMSRDIVFMFPGQGSQFPTMGLPLFQHEPVFRKVIEEADACLTDILGESLTTILYSDKNRYSEHRLRQTEITQAALYVTEYAYAKFLISKGLLPKSLIGHSIGEYVAAALAGVFTFTEGLHVVVNRGRIMQQAKCGSMLAVAMSAEEISRYIDSAICVAVINSPQSCVVAGAEGDIDTLRAILQESGRECTTLNTSHAFHSNLMKDASDAFYKSIENINFKAPSMPFISNVSGDWIQDAEAMSAAYWAKQLRTTVQFSKGLETLFAENASLLIECGPGITLKHIVNSHSARTEDHLAISVSRHSGADEDERICALRSVGLSWVAGVELEWSSYRTSDMAKKVSLPLYQFGGSKFWYKEKESSSAKSTYNESEPLVSTDPGEWLWTENWAHKPASPGRISGARCRQMHLIYLGAEIPLLFEELRRSGRFEACSHSSLDGWASMCEQMREKSSDLTVILVCNVKNPLEIYTSALELIKSLNELDLTSLHLDIVTLQSLSTLGKKIKQAAGSVISGMVPVILREFPDFKVRQLDVDNLADPYVLSALVQKASEADAELILSYSHKRWWSRIYHNEKIELNEESDIVEGEAHIIIGAFGGIGYELTKYLGRKCKKLLLVGRTIPPESQWQGILDEGKDSSKIKIIKLISELRSEGILIVTACMDIEDPAGINDLRRLATEYIPERGYIFNLAGQSSDGLIVSKTSAGSMGVLGAKITGSTRLIKAFSKLENHVIVLFSSTAAWLGPAGQVDYSAANAYQMAIATLETVQTRVRVIAWPAWRGTGMVARMPDSPDKDRASKEGIDIDQALRLLPRLLRDDIPATCAISPVSIRSKIEKLQKRTCITSNPGKSVSQEQKTDESKSDVANSESALSIVSSYWKQALGVKELLPTSDFYQLGGNSLLLTRLVSRINRQKRVRLPLERAISTPVLESWIEMYKSASAVKLSTGTSLGIKEIARHPLLTPGICRFLTRRNNKSLNRWNLSVLLKCTVKLDVDVLKAVVQHLIEIHPMLRASLRRKDGRYHLQINDVKDCDPVVFIDLESQSKDIVSSIIEKEANAAQASLDLEKGVVFKVVLFKCAPDTPDRLLLLVHHFMSDGLSWTLTLSDFQTIYKSIVAGEVVSMPEPATSYAQWSRYLRTVADYAVKRGRADYWLSRNWDRIQAIPCDFDYSKTGNTNSSAKVASADLTQRQSALLQERIKGIASIETVSIAVLARVLANWTGSKYVLIDILGHGREINSDVDVSRTVGYFNSYIPALLEVEESKSLDTQIKVLINQIEEMQGLGIEHDLLRYMSTDKKSRSKISAEIPGAQVLFNYIGQLKDSNDALLDSSCFSIAEECEGSNHDGSAMRDHALALRMEIEDNTFSFALVYSRNIHKQITAEDILGNFVEELLRFLDIPN